MSLSLSSPEIAGLEKALRALLSPLRCESTDEWMQMCMRRVRRLLQADHVHFCLPGPGWVSNVDSSAKESYVAYYHQFDRAPNLAARRSVEVSAYEDLIPPDVFRASEFYNDWVRPNRLHHNHGMTDIGFGQYNYLAVSHNSQSKATLVRHGVGLLRLLQPAYKAGIRTWQDQMERRETLAALLDAVGERLALCDERGRISCVNRALEQSLDADAQRERLTQAMTAAARQLALFLQNGADPGSLPRPYRGRKVTTDLGTYRLRLSYLGRTLFPGVTILIAVEPLFRAPLTDGELRERFSLTPQEIRVARLIAASAPNHEIADNLAISPHTSRRHTEHIMEKLGVVSRTQVAEKISRR